MPCFHFSGCSSQRELAFLQGRPHVPRVALDHCHLLRGETAAPPVHDLVGAARKAMQLAVAWDTWRRAFRVCRLVSRATWWPEAAGAHEGAQCSVAPTRDLRM